ncbi:MAG: GNAT family N-acetyltransferase, partial [Terracidiphilus sp.]
LELRIEQIRDEHIEPYIQLSRAEFGDEAAVSQANHLRWKFIENPQGPSTGIHLYRDGELVARMVALSRQFLHLGRIFKAAHIVDFLVHPKERGMNSLLQLVVGLKRLSGYDFLLIMAPNPAGAAVWENFVKMPGHFDLDVAVAPLRPAALFHSVGKLHSGAFASVVDWPWRVVLGAAARLSDSFSHAQVDTEWPRPSEFEQMLSGDWGNRIFGLRSAQYLDWRYRQSPVFRYNVSFLRERGELLGYLVTRRTVYNGIDCLFIVDAFGRPEVKPALWRAASRKEISKAQNDGVEMAMIFGNTAWGPISAVKRIPFLRVPPRFLPRKTTVYAQWVNPPGFDFLRENFYVALGDSDVI